MHAEVVTLFKTTIPKDADSCQAEAYQRFHTAALPPPLPLSQPCCLSSFFRLSYSFTNIHSVCFCPAITLSLHTHTTQYMGISLRHTFGLPVALLSLLLLLSLTGCSPTKHVPQGEYLLDKVKIVTDSKEVKPETLKPYLRQEPNFRILGVARLQLAIYNLSGADTSKWINRWLRKIGTPRIVPTTLQSAIECGIHARRGRGRYHHQETRHKSNLPHNYKRAFLHRYDWLSHPPCNNRQYRAVATLSIEEGYAARPLPTR